MSGQPYKYHTDPTKFRTEYMDTLGLQADINEMNLEANRTYKETGQLPPVSQMKDTRSPSEILLDYEKLKIDLIKSISKMSSSQFGQDVVSRIIKSPLNSDNKLLVFAAQRIEDIVFNVKKLYRYGIKGDAGDVEQFVNFIETMYNDKNALASQTKAFMDSQGIRKMDTANTIFSSVREVLYTVGVQQANFQKLHNTIQNALIDTYGANAADRVFDNYNYNETEMTSRAIVSLIKALTHAIEIDPSDIAYLERQLFAGTGESGALSGITPDDLYTEDYGIIRSYLDFIRTGIPAKAQLLSISKQLEVYINQLKESIKIINPSNTTILSGITTNFIKINTVQQNLLNALQPKEEWDTESINNIFNDVMRIVHRYSHHGGMQPQQVEHDGTISELTEDEYNSFNPSSNSSFGTNTLNSLMTPTTNSSFGTNSLNSFMTPTTNSSLGSNTLNSLMTPTTNSSLGSNTLNSLMTPTTNSYSSNETEEPQDDDAELYAIEIINTRYFRTLDEYNELDHRALNAQTDEEADHYEQQAERKYRQLQQLEQAKQYLVAEYEHKFNRPYTGEGLKKKKSRGRPKGSGIKPHKTFTESFKSNLSMDKGIMESPRYVKFGRYLINNHKLNNEDTFIIRRPSGGNIVEFPSIKVSKNMSSVIKKMVSGGAIGYSDISKLSEPEKTYLHKIAKKSNILDKFDIPAPSKDEKEKDIHQFEVMKGEIMAGNDSNELVKKFKLHIMKMSKNGSLPKRDVAEILEDLISLGF